MRGLRFGLPCGFTPREQVAAGFKEIVNWAIVSFRGALFGRRCSRKRKHAAVALVRRVAGRGRCLLQGGEKPEFHPRGSSQIRMSRRASLSHDGSFGVVTAWSFLQLCLCTVLFFFDNDRNWEVALQTIQEGRDWQRIRN